MELDPFVSRKKKWRKKRAPIFHTLSTKTPCTNCTVRALFPTPPEPSTATLYLKTMLILYFRNGLYLCFVGNWAQKKNKTVAKKEEKYFLMYKRDPKKKWICYKKLILDSRNDFDDDCAFSEQRIFCPFGKIKKEKSFA